MLAGTVLSVEEAFLPVLIVIRADSVEVGQQNRRVRHEEAAHRGGGEAAAAASVC